MSDCDGCEHIHGEDKEKTELRDKVKILEGKLEAFKKAATKAQDIANERLKNCGQDGHQIQLQSEASELRLLVDSIIGDQ